jgi:hypothetical protein
VEAVVLVVQVQRRVLGLAFVALAGGMVLAISKRSETRTKLL